MDDTQFAIEHMKALDIYQDIELVSATLTQHRDGTSELDITLRVKPSAMKRIYPIIKKRAYKYSLEGGILSNDDLEISASFQGLTNQQYTDDEMLSIYGELPDGR